MKKVLALLLAVVMVIGMTTMAMAEDAEGTKTFTVKYTGEGKPAETFTFSDFTFVSVTEAGVDANGNVITTGPAITKIADVTIAADATEGTATITLPEFPAVGIYTYTFNEVAGTKAGVTYYTDTMKLVVTVVQDGANKVRVAAVHVQNGSTNEDKTGEIENTYAKGTLAVKKIVAGNMGDRKKPFDITVTFAAEGKDIASEITYTGAQSGTVNGNTVTLSLKHDDTVTFANIPEGVTWSVEEEDYSEEGYTVSYSTQTKEMAANAVDTCDVTNTKTGTVDTGIVLDSLPYILIGVAVAAAAVLMVAKKRRIED